MDAAKSLNRLLAEEKRTLGDVRVKDALEKSPRFLCGREWTVYTNDGIIVLTDANILYTDVVGILSKETWRDEPYGPTLLKDWQVVFCMDTHLIKEWYRGFDSTYCCYYTPTEFVYPEYITPIIRHVEVPGQKEHMLLCWIHEFATAVKTMDKTKMFGPYPDFTSHMSTDLMRQYSDGIRALVADLAHAQRLYFATFGVS